MIQHRGPSWNTLDVSIEAQSFTVRMGVSTTPRAYLKYNNKMALFFSVCFSAQTLTVGPVLGYTTGAGQLRTLAVSDKKHLHKPAHTCYYAATNKTFKSVPKMVRFYIVFNEEKEQDVD